MRKIISKIKYYSFLIVPIIVCGVTFLFLSDQINKFPSAKVDGVISISSTMIGALLTVLTIYLSFPMSAMKERMKISKHHDILLHNISSGLISFTVCIVSWLFLDHAAVLIMSFIWGLSNVVIVGYYIAILGKLFK